MASSEISKQSGFSLIEIAVALLVLGLAIGMTLKFTRGMQDGQNRQQVRVQLDAIEAALANFVAINKRLPCPANGTLAANAVGVGLEVISPGPPPAANPPIGQCSPTNQINGVVPWMSIGLNATDVIDPWGGRILYRVDPVLAQATPLAALMNMSNCDPSSTGAAVAGACKAPVPSCTGNANCTSPLNFLAGKGLDVWNGINGVAGWNLRQNNRGAGTGAAYVLISQGPTGTAAYNARGILQPGTMAAGTNETPNRNNRALAIPSALANTYRDATLNDVAGAAHFDDYISHPSITSVINRANLGPRAH